VQSNIVSIIAAKRTSSDLPNKNVLTLDSKPVVYHNIEAAVNCPEIDMVCVTSDSDEILGIAEKIDSKIQLVRRPVESASLSSDIALVVSQAIRVIEEQGKDFDIILLLKGSIPLLNKHSLEDAIQCFLNSDCESLISVTNIGYALYKSFTLDKDGLLIPIFHSNFIHKNSQSLPIAYYSNGGISMCYKEVFLKNRSFVSNQTLPFFMEARDCFDIDSQEDLDLAEMILRDSKYMRPD